jgi:signal transduction histidine kinase
VSAQATAEPSGDAVGLEPDELDRRLRAHHKALFTRILLPTVTVMTFFLIIAYWRFDTKFYLGLVAVAVLDIFNVYFSIRNRRIPTPWGVVESRSDAFDTFRWSVNFPLDAFIAWSFEAPTAAIVVAWIILTFGALTEVYNRGNKLITALVSLLCLVILLNLVNPVPATDQLFLAACFVSVLFIFWRLEVSLVKEMQEFAKERLQREHVEAEAEKMRRDAVIGASVRSLTHEINNLAAIASLTSMQIRNDATEKVENLERLDRSLELMTKTSCLVLDDIGGYCATLRSYALNPLLRDTRLLLGGLAREEKAELRFKTPATRGDPQFIERSGSTYLIIHNLVKNAFQATRDKFGDRAGGVVEIAAGVDGEQILVSVTDNGVGMTEQQAELIREGRAETSRSDGHGLGMRFVHRECLENGYDLEVASTLGEGTRFTVQIPLQLG